MGEVLPPALLPKHLSSLAVGMRGEGIMLETKPFRIVDSSNETVSIKQNEKGH